MAAINNHDVGIRVLVVSIHLQSASRGLLQREGSMT